MKETINFLPCPKHLENISAEMPRMDVPFFKIEMCTHIIAMLSMNMSVVYCAAKGTEFSDQFAKNAGGFGAS